MRNLAAAPPCAALKTQDERSSDVNIYRTGGERMPLLELLLAAGHKALRIESRPALWLTETLVARSKHQRWRTLPDICAGPSGGHP